MTETEYIGMQTEATNGIVGAAILVIAHYGMTEVGHVYANLVFTSCHQLTFHQRIAATLLQYIIICYCELTTIIHRA